MNLVLDASVIVKVYIPEELSDKVESVFQKIERKRVTLFAPDLIYPETGNIKGKAWAENIGWISFDITLKLVSDGTIEDPDVGGTVIDEIFGERAQITCPPGVLNEPTDVAIDVFEEPLDIPIPTGFTGTGTLFVNIKTTPEISSPLPPPGLTIVLPLINPMTPGSVLELFRIDPETGSLIPALHVLYGVPVLGTVNPDGLSATFTGIANLSTVVGLVPELQIISVTINIKPGSYPNSINLTSKGVVPVAVLTTDNFDTTTVDPLSAQFGPGGAKEAHGKGHIEDADGDGDMDLVLHFKLQDSGIQCGDTEANLIGETFDDKAIEGFDSINTLGCK